MRNDRRKPETLFGSGQRNANRGGRKAVSVEPSLAKIVERSLRLRDSEGRVVKTSLGEMTEMSLYREALKNTKGARQDLFRRYHQEQMAAIDRPRRVRPGPAQKQLVQAITTAIERQFEPITAVLDELERAGVIVRVGRERFIAGWAVQAAVLATIKRISGRNSSRDRD